MRAFVPFWPLGWSNNNSNSNGANTEGCHTRCLLNTLHVYCQTILTTALGDSNHSLHPHFIEEASEAYEVNHGWVSEEIRGQDRCPGHPSPCLEVWGCLSVLRSRERWPHLRQGGGCGWPALGGVAWPLGSSFLDAFL